MTKEFETELELARYYNAEESMLKSVAMLDNVLRYRVYTLSDCNYTFEDEKHWYLEQVFTELRKDIHNINHIMILTNCVGLLLEHDDLPFESPINFDLLDDYFEEEISRAKQ